MKSTSKGLAGAALEAAADDSASRLDEERRLAERAHEELLSMGMPRVNLLLMGHAGVTANVLGRLTDGLHEPVVSWAPGEPFVLPPVERTGTVVLHEIGALGIEEQVRLLEWLSGAVGHTQVVSTTASSLLPRIRAGAFIDMLYYRLNTVCFDLSH